MEYFNNKSINNMIFIYNFQLILLKMLLFLNFQELIIVFD